MGNKKILVAGRLFGVRFFGQAGGLKDSRNTKGRAGYDDRANRFQRSRFTKKEEVKGLSSEK